VFRARHQAGRLALTGPDDDFEELIGYIAAEANHEPRRARQRHLDHAYDVINTALTTTP
jgi:hypothetical protein